MNVLLVDNRDSFTHNLADAFRIAGSEVTIVRNTINADDAMAMANGLILLSPGPGTPAEAGCCLDLVRIAAKRVPVVGICLGHQAIVEAEGGLVERAAEPFHGRSCPVDHGGTGAFAGLPSPSVIGRYHSLCTPTPSLPGGFIVDAELGGMAMAVRHEEAGQLGVQFHPESILTPQGDRMIANILRWARGWHADQMMHAA